MKICGHLVPYPQRLNGAGSRVFCKQEIPKNAKKNPQWGVGKNGVMH